MTTRAVMLTSVLRRSAAAGNAACKTVTSPPPCRTFHSSSINPRSNTGKHHHPHPRSHAHAHGRRPSRATPFPHLHRGHFATPNKAIHRQNSTSTNFGGWVVAVSAITGGAGSALVMAQV